MAGADEKLDFFSSTSSKALDPSSSRLGHCSNIPNSQSSNEMNISSSRQQIGLGSAGGESFRDVDDCAVDDDMPHELKIIDDMGNFKCVKKSTTGVKLRQSELQRYFHTKTRLLPEFPLTEELKAITCPTEVMPSVVEAVAKVAHCSEDDMSPREIASRQKTAETKAQLDHLNPFNLDLNALSDYQWMKHEREELENFRRYHSIASEMKIKALKDELIQTMRNEKFQLPQFFRLPENGEKDLKVLAQFTEIGKNRFIKFEGLVKFF